MIYIKDDNSGYPYFEKLPFTLKFFGFTPPFSIAISLLRNESPCARLISFYDASKIGGAVEKDIGNGLIARFLTIVINQFIMISTMLKILLIIILGC